MWRFTAVLWKKRISDKLCFRDKNWNNLFIFILCNLCWTSICVHFVCIFVILCNFRLFCTFGCLFLTIFSSSPPPVFIGRLSRPYSRFFTGSSGGMPKCLLEMHQQRSPLSLMSNDIAVRHRGLQSLFEFFSIVSVTVACNCLYNSNVN